MVRARTSFVKGDIFEQDLSAASVLTMYLTEAINARLRPKLLALKPGTRIVSNSFQFGDWQADDSVTAISFKSLLAPFLENNKDHCFFLCTAYLWILPARVEGRWRIAGGELVLRQSFQMVSGVVTVGGKSVPVTNSRLRDSALSFTAGDTAYAGQVGAGRIDGTARRNGVTLPWNAALSAALPNAP